MTRINGFLFPLLAGLVVFVWSTPAQAIPSFARKYEMACSGCHSAWPMLNATGRNFREQGYKFSDGEELLELSDFLKWDQNLPVSGIVVSRPYDKQDTGNVKVRALHEAELMIAGRPAEDISLFFEFEAEDDEGFNVVLADAILGWHLSDWFNVHVAWSPLFHADPYDTLSASRRATVNRNSVIDQRFGGADNNGRLRDARQTVAIYGRPLEQVYYSIGWSGVAGATEGENARTVSGRLAVEPLPELMVGLFGVAGECTVAASNCVGNRDYSRFGVDFQSEFDVLDDSALRFMGAFVTTEDENSNNATDVSNNAWYAQAFYIHRQDGRPWLMPSVRFDNYEQNDGADDFDELDPEHDLLLPGEHQAPAGILDAVGNPPGDGEKQPSHPTDGGGVLEFFSR